MENPYIASPSLTLADAWARGFFSGFANPMVGLDPPVEVLPEDASAYGEGVQAGIQAGIDGIFLSNECIPAAEVTSDAASGFASAAWGTWSLGALLVGPPGIAAMVARGLITVIRIGLHTRHTLPVEAVLPSLAQPLLDTLSAYGVGSLEVYLGLGRDELATDCEFLVTPLFPRHDSARAAVEALGRPDWLIVSWRTDQSNSFRVVEYAGNVVL